MEVLNEWILIFKIGKYGEESDAYKTLGHSITKLTKESYYTALSINHNIIYSGMELVHTICIRLYMPE